MTRFAGGYPILGVAGFVALLELVPRLGLVSPDYLPPASRILSALGDLAGTGVFWRALLDTGITWLTGLLIAAAAAIIAGVVIGLVPLLRTATESTIEFLRPIPSVALIPLAILLYGTARTATLLLVVYAAFWQVLVQVLAGVADVDPLASDTARSYRLAPGARIRFLIWPTALPYVVTGVRLATSVALILTITGELFVGTPGLGKQIGLAQSGGAVPTMYALVVVTGLIGVGANLLTRAVERRVLAWHPSVRREVAV